MNSAGSIVIVRDHADLLANVVADNLTQSGIAVCLVEPHRLADLPIHLQQRHFYIRDQRVRGIFFRAHPETTFSADYVETDRSFVDAEIKALWLAALHLPGVLAVNRYDAAAWFEGLRWLTFRRILLHNHIPVSRFSFGHPDGKQDTFWHLYGRQQTRACPPAEAGRYLGPALTTSLPAATCLILADQILAGNPHPVALEAARVLAANGVYLAEITLDDEERVLTVNTQPVLNECAWLSSAAASISEMYCDHMLGR